MDIWKICKWREDAKLFLLCPTHSGDGGICCSIYMNLSIWAKDMHKQKFKHLENIFDHHLQVKRKLKKKLYHFNTKDTSAARAVLIICCYWLVRLCTEKLLKRTKYIGCKQGIYFRFFMALNGDRSQSVQKKSQKAARYLPKALQRNKKKYQRRGKMHTLLHQSLPWNKCYCCTETRVENDLNMQVATLRTKMSNLFNGLRPFFDSLWYIKRLRDAFILPPFKWQ